jgi:LysM repeat protein
MAYKKTTTKTSYPKSTSIKTGKTTWSDGKTSTVKKTTPTYGSATLTASASQSALSKVLSSLKSYLSQQTTSAVNTLKSGGSGVSTTGKSMSVNPKTQPTYTVQNGQLVAVPQKTANVGVASKQTQPVADAQGKAISGTYTKNSSGAYQAVPMQSLGYQAGNIDKVKNVKKASDNFQLNLNSAKTSAWDSMGTKEDKMTGIMESAAGEFGKNWNSVDEMNFDYNSNPSIKSALDQYVANGGTLEQIMSKIQANQASAQPYTVQQGDTLSAIASRTGKSVAEIMSLNPQITNPNLIQAGSALNLGAKVQDSQAYLSEMKKNVVTNPEALLNMPQDKLLQNEIARQAGIPQQWKDYYLGTPEKMGVFELEKANKQAELDLIEEKLADDKRVYKEKAQLQIDKTRAEMDMALAETETNRLKAKNYMTGLLAKLGALNTTGAAGESLVKLDQKYEEMKMNTKAKYTMAIRELEIDMNEGIDAIENGYADKSNKIREDLTKSATDITKELMKLDLESQSKIYSLTSSYAKLLQTQKEKAQKAIKAGADAYTTTFKDIVSYGIPIGATQGLGFESKTQQQGLMNTYLGKPTTTRVATTEPKFNFSYADRKKLAEAGMSNAPQSEQFAFLNKKSGSTSTKTSSTSSGISDEEKEQALKELGF